MPNSIRTRKGVHVFCVRREWSGTICWLHLLALQLVVCYIGACNGGLSRVLPQPPTRSSRSTAASRLGPRSHISAPGLRGSTKSGQSQMSKLEGRGVTKSRASRVAASAMLIEYRRNLLVSGWPVGSTLFLRGGELSANCTSIARGALAKSSTAKIRGANRHRPTCSVCKQDEATKGLCRADGARVTSFMCRTLFL